MYSRFQALETTDENALEELQNSTAAVVGLGATGSPIAENLARHGVELILVDRDYLEEKDVYSSSIYTPEDVEKGLPKAAAAEKHLSEMTEVEAHVESLNAETVEILEDADIILDGTDNLETRFLIDEYCQKTGQDWIYTAAIGEKAYSMLFKNNCFSCIFEDVAAGQLDTCETAGIMRAISQMVGSLSAYKAVRYLSGRHVSEQLDMLPSGRSLEVESDGCEVCMDGEYQHLESSASTTAVCGKNKYQLEREVSDDAFGRLRGMGDILADNEHLTRAVIDGREFTLFNSGRAIIQADSRGEAESRFTEILGI